MPAEACMDFIGGGGFRRFHVEWFITKYELTEEFYNNAIFPQFFHR